MYNNLYKHIMESVAKVVKQTINEYMDIDDEDLLEKAKRKKRKTSKRKKKTTRRKSQYGKGYTGWAMPFGRPFGGFGHPGLMPPPPPPMHGGFDGPGGDCGRCDCGGDCGM